MSLAAAQFVGLAREQLLRCDLAPDATVMIYADPASRQELVDGCFAAAHSLDLDVFVATVPSVGGGRARMPAALLAAAAGASLVIDASGRGMLHSTMQVELLATGARILRVREPVDVLARLCPSPAIAGAVRAAGAAIDAASEMRVTGDGTDITFSLRGRRAAGQIGYVDVPGRWDHWGTALVAAAPEEHAGDGTITLAPGDIYFLSATKGCTVTTPVVLTVRGGAIERAEGSREARDIERILDPEAGGPDARRISHVGWGCHPRAQWDALERYGADGGGGADVRSVEGGVVLAFGANEDLGGTNVTTAHMDLALRRLTVELDGVAFVRDGAVVAGAGAATDTRRTSDVVDAGR